jgi:hypothetical protein
MDRVMIEEHLALAERHVSRGEELIAQQKQRIAEMERDGHDSRLHRELLEQFEEVQRLHLADLARLRNELNEILGGA